MESEDDFTRWLIERTGGKNSSIGDDCAVLTEYDPPGLLTQDSLVKMVHFDDSYSSSEVGAKLAAVNLSDIAAMGGIPNKAVLSTMSSSESDSLKAVVEGVLERFQTHDVELVGGDLSSATGSCQSYALTILGETLLEGYLARSKASPGDSIAVTGPIGGVRAVLQSDETPSRSQHYLLTDPPDRVDLGQELVRRGLRCGMDLSDGLIKDLSRICERSGVGAILDPELIPVHPVAEELAREENEALKWALQGGEDFELLVTIPDDVSGLSDSDALTVIGEVTETSGISFKPEPPFQINTDELGYDHFT